jgi:GDP-4-dehydro-6-deoxy-D-mannose reductase
LPTALITGITGFVGPWLAAHLQAHRTPCVGLARGSTLPSHPVSLAGVPLHDVDIRNRAQVRQVIETVRPDLVFHLAAISHVPSTRTDPALAFDVNVGGTFNLLESLRQTGLAPRVVLVSTGNLYGHLDSGEGGFIEESPVHPNSPYAATKLMSEELAHAYARDFSLPIVIARPFNHTGPGQPPFFVCSEFAQAIAARLGRENPVHLKTGALEPRRDLSDVRDVVRAYAMLAASATPGETYNVGSGSMIAVAEILRILGELAGVEVLPEVDPARLRVGEILRSGGNCSKIRDALGWTPQIPFRQTLSDLLHYWTQNTAELRPSTLS